MIFSREQIRIRTQDARARRYRSAVCLFWGLAVAMVLWCGPCGDR
jgi:hypothetical protein